MGKGKQETIELYENRCAVCYVPFVQKRQGRLRRTCSSACRQALYRMRRAKNQPEKTKQPVKQSKPIERAGTVCPVCDGVMVQPERGRKRKACSEACRKRLWRQQNPRCLACGKRFTMARFQKEMKYCSVQCKGRANEAMRRLRKRERAIAEMASYRPDWMPRKGSGYREEHIPWEDDEDGAVVWEREPQPNYEREDRRSAQEEREAWHEETLAEIERLKKARQLAYELLEDDSKWW